ncbi:MAG: hypothetical protein CVV42_12885 [Candidatus Riflebacteria bacterium HGW-Riflebacteria-2]|jgi:hypothetical protein|nr:MAG: hypothetical protein CVV42_12885 [Candidatus Riflebacteria bacterium HGW-Riflebacteria-2]
MNDELNNEQCEIPSELGQKLQDIKDRCMPPPRISHNAFYIMLFIASMVPYVAHSLVTDGIDWDAMRFGHGLLPLNVLMMRNAIVPKVLPFLVGLFYLFSFKFKSLCSPVFLAWFTLVMFGLVAAYTWTSGMFAFYLLSIS